MLRDPVTHRQKIGLHELLYATDHLIASFVCRSSFRDQRRYAKRLAQTANLFHHVACRISFCGGLLRHASTCRQQHHHSAQKTSAHGSSFKSSHYPAVLFHNSAILATPRSSNFDHAVPFVGLYLTLTGPLMEA